MTAYCSACATCSCGCITTTMGCCVMDRLKGGRGVVEVCWIGQRPPEYYCCFSRVTVRAKLRFGVVELKSGAVFHALRLCVLRVLAARFENALHYSRRERS